MKKLLVYLKAYKKESILAPLFKMLEAAFELLVPLVMAAVIDKGISNGNITYIIKMCFLMILLGVVGLVCSVTAQYFAAKAAVGFGTKLRHEIFAHIGRLSFTSLDKVGTSTLITRMTSDINQVQSGVNMVLRLFLRSPFIVFGAMVMAFTIDVRSAVVFAVAIPLLSIVVFGVMLICIPLYKKVQERLDKVLLATRENLTGVRVIRAFHMEKEEQEKFRERNSLLTVMQMFVGRISTLMNPITYIIINIATAYLIWTGALRVNNGMLSQGEVVALISYMSQILVELIKLANLIITVTKAFACANRVKSVLEIPKDEDNMSLGREGKEDRLAGEDGRMPLVEFSHVGLCYQGAKEESITDVTFQAYPGETVGIIGGTGAGKTSLVHLIPGFYPHTSGSIRIGGKEIDSLDKAALRAQIGIVMQKSVLFGGTIRQNLCWGKTDATDEELKEALITAQAWEFVKDKEGGLDAHVSQGGKNFSGGQKQRLTIARALVRKPRILILDDSASALDFATDAALRKAIRSQEDAPLVFLVSQRSASIQYADKIIVLDDGQVAGIGSHKELLESCPVYQEIYYSQFPKKRVGKGAANEADR